MANDTIKQKFVIEVDGEGKLVSYTNSLKENDEAGKKAINKFMSFFEKESIRSIR